MKKTRISEWPVLYIQVHPDTKERIEARADERGLTVSVLVREALAELVAPVPPSEAA
jgi:hypothetical protein